MAQRLALIGRRAAPAICSTTSYLVVGSRKRSLPVIQPIRALGVSILGPLISANRSAPVNPALAHCGPQHGHVRQQAPLAAEPRSAGPGRWTDTWLRVRTIVPMPCRFSQPTRAFL